MTAPATFNPLKAKTTFILNNERFKDLEQLSGWVEENLNEHEKDACTIEVDAYAGETDTFSSHFLASVSHYKGILFLRLWVDHTCVARHSPVCFVEEIRLMDSDQTEAFLWGKVQAIISMNLAEIKEATRLVYEAQMEDYRDEMDFQKYVKTMPL